ncbi:MAG TPA: tyrosinase family protein [Allosphingosinicella sp.]
MTYTRRNIYDLGSDWADPALWYARGVKALKDRPLALRTSWRFFAGMHGFAAPRWQRFGYFDPATDQMPGSADYDAFWQQCQHGSWYFLPWHRGYLAAFEAVVRAAIVDLGGPEDWALPYWNYFKPGQNQLPPQFASPDWPDGTGDNPLFVEARYGPFDDGNVYVPLEYVNLEALHDEQFEGAADGGPTGFGGVETGFEHGGRVHGGLETQPHDYVHGLVGGAVPDTDPPYSAVMSHPNSAALDPIFWLHHANIDRLWASWRNGAGHNNPDEQAWLAGPTSIGERRFAMPAPNGSTWHFTPADVSDLSQMDYVYDDLDPVLTESRTERRLKTFNLDATVFDKLLIGGAVAKPRNVELLGANDRPLSVAGAGTQASVRVAAPARAKLTETFSNMPRGSVPDRVFLNLENVRGLSDAAAFSVYINLPEGERAEDHPELLAGSVALFGVSKATESDGEQAGDGITYSFEITRIIDQLHLREGLDSDSLDVRIIPIKPVPESAEISIGRIGIYRQGS